MGVEHEQEEHGLCREPREGAGRLRALVQRGGKQQLEQLEEHHAHGVVAAFGPVLHLEQACHAPRVELQGAVGRVRRGAQSDLRSVERREARRACQLALERVERRRLLRRPARP